MEYPKTSRGRPRRRPYAAHDARAVKTRAENAMRWLKALRWCLDGHPEVREHFAMVAPEWSMNFRRQQPVMVETLARLVRSLAEPIAPDEGQSDG